MTETGISVRTAASELARPASATVTPSSVRATAALVVADDVVRGAGRNAMDVLARPGRDERNRGAAQDTLATLGALVPRNEPGESHDHESGQGNSRAHDDEELARPGPNSGDREHRRRRQRCR